MKNKTQKQIQNTDELVPVMRKKNIKDIKYVQGESSFQSPYNWPTQPTQPQEEDILKILRRVYINGIKVGAKDESARDNCLLPALKNIKNLISEIRKEERERQYDMMMKCLPSDAENLSTLIPDQAQRLIKCFIKKHPWN